MKKILLLAFLSFSFVGFAAFDYDDFMYVSTVYTYTWTDFNTTLGRLYTPTYNVYSIDQMRSIYSSSTFGFSVKLRRTTSGGYNFTLQCPGSPTSFGGSYWTSVTITNSVLVRTNGVSTICSPLYFKEVSPIFQTAATLFCNGYRGSGFPDIYQGGQDVYCVNVDFPTLVSDVLSSTNTAFRSLLLSSLSEVNSSLSIIIQSLSEIASRSPSSSSSEIWDYDKITNYLSSVDGNIYIDGIYFPSEEVLYHVVNSPLKDSTSPSDRAQYENYVQSVGRALPLLQSLSGLGSLLSGNPIGQSSVSSGLELLGNQFNKRVNDNLSSIGGNVASISSGFNRLSTNDWASVVTNKLAKNHDSITNQLAHIFDDEPYSAGRAIRQTAINTADISSGVSSLNQHFVDGLLVHVDSNNPITINGESVTSGLDASAMSADVRSIRSNVANWYSAWYSFFNVSSPSYAWDKYFDMVSQFKEQNHKDISSITNSFSSLSSVSNLLALIDNQLRLAFPELTNEVDDLSSSFHALLLDDYSDYITNQFYSSAVDTFREEYPSVYTNLVKFGLSTQDGEGNFWSLFSSTLFYQSALVCGMLEDLATVRQFAENNIQGGFQGGVTSLIDKFPSPSQLQDYLNQASNQVLRIESASDDFNAAYSYMTNASVSAFAPFRGIFSSVPENLVFFKTANEKYITIPVSRGGNAWLVIRLCFSFSVAAVNIILFPRFVLMVVVLLSKLSKRFVKFVPIDR